MKIQDLKRIAEAPEHGQLMAYTRTEILFHPYGNKEEVVKELENENLLELHLFDQNKEYRCIVTESRRYPDGVIEYVSDFPDLEDQSVFREKILTGHGYSPDYITVLNHVTYNEKNGMAEIDDYRLIC